MGLFPFRAALRAAPVVVALSMVGSVEAAGPRSSLQYDARFLRYDHEKDEILHAESSVTGPLSNPPGMYHGSRLGALRYVGPPGRGGIYDALAEDQARRKLDPKKYRYRTKYPAGR